MRCIFVHEYRPITFLSVEQTGYNLAARVLGRSHANGFLLARNDLAFQRNMNKIDLSISDIEACI